MTTQSPYNWSTGCTHEVHRSGLVDEICRGLVRGEGVLLRAGPGMGKSAIVEQCRRQLLPLNDTQVVTVPSSVAHSPVLQACFERLCSALGVSFDMDIETVLREWDQRHGGFLCLLLDDVGALDRQEQGAAAAWLSVLEAGRRSHRNLGLLAVGGAAMRDSPTAYGSPFASRARPVTVRPMSQVETSLFLAPLSKRRQISLDATCTAHTLSGGVPAVLAYLCQELWVGDGPVSSVEVGDLVDRFARDHRPFISSVWRQLQREPLGVRSRKAYEAIRANPSPSSLWRSLEQLAARDGVFVDPRDLVDALVGSGLAAEEASGSVRVTSSILALPEWVPPATGSSATQILNTVLSDLPRLAPDFRRVGGEIVPESVFSAFLTAALRQSGHVAEREAIEGAGRTDIKYSGHDVVGHGIVEVKIWGRNDYRNIDQQVRSYFTSETSEALAVMITKGKASGYETSVVPKGYCAAETGNLHIDMFYDPTGKSCIRHALVRLPIR